MCSDLFYIYLYVKGQDFIGLVMCTNIPNVKHIILTRYQVSPQPAKTIHFRNFFVVHPLSKHEDNSTKRWTKQLQTDFSFNFSFFEVQTMFLSEC